MSSTISIGGTTLTNIVNMEVVLNDLDKDSSRNALGGLVRNRVAQIPEIKLTFGVKSKSDMETLLGLLKPASFSVTYYLPHTQSTLTANFYAGPHFPKILIDSSDVYYSEMDVSLIGYNGI